MDGWHRNRHRYGVLGISVLMLVVCAAAARAWTIQAPAGGAPVTVCEALVTGSVTLTGSVSCQ